MVRTVLIWCAEEGIVQVLRGILEDLGVCVEHCRTASEAEARVSEKRFDAMIVDFDGQGEAAAAVLRKSHSSSLNHNALAITIVASNANVREIFALGSNFVLYKPISEMRAKASLRAAYGLMGRERRKTVRLAVHSQATIDYSTVENAEATLIDLSEEGTAIQSEKKLPPRCKVYFKFNLPEQASTVRLSAEVVWQDSAGRVGMRFVDVPQSSRRILRDWLGKAFVDAQNVARAESVRGAAAATTALPASSGPATQSRPNDGLARLRAAPGNRRGQSRKPCQFGAEVYKAGSGVPNRCSLSDISAGGCYVEMPSPFATETQVEVQVRTRDLKVRIPGIVQSVHPGFGMGVRFVPKSALDRENVSQLLAQLSDSAQGTEFGPAEPWLK